MGGEPDSETKHEPAMDGVVVAAKPKKAVAVHTDSCTAARKQKGKPREEDLENWAHHTSTDSLPDPIFRVSHNPKLKLPALDDDDAEEDAPASAAPAAAAPPPPPPPKPVSSLLLNSGVRPSLGRGRLGRPAAPLHKSYARARRRLY